MDQTYGIKLTADGSGLVGATTEAAKAQEKLAEQFKKTEQAAKSTAEQSRAFADEMKKSTTAVDGAAVQARAFQAVTDRMPGTLGAAARATSGLGTAFVLLAAGVIEAVKAHEQHERAIGRMEAALAGQGRSYELNRSQLSQLTREIALLPGVTNEAATQVVAATTRMRGLSGEQIQQIARLSADLAVVLGTSVPEAAKKLAAGIADPAKGMRELDEQLNLLTVSQKLSIEAFLRQGDEARAQAALFDALRSRIAGLSDQAMTPLERATDRLTTGWQSLMQRMADSSAIRTVADGFASIVDKAAWLVENADRIGMAVLRAAPQTAAGMALAGAALGGTPGMSEVYDRAGYWGDARDATVARGNAASLAEQERLKRLIDAAGRYDKDADRRALMGQRGQFQAALGGLDPSSEEYQRLTAGIAGIDKLLAPKEKKGRTLDDVLMASSGLDKSYYQDLQLLHAGYDQGRISLEQYQAAVVALTEKQAFARELARDEADAVRKAKQEREAFERALQRVNQEQQREIDQAAERNKRLQEHIEELGLTTEQLGRLNVKRAEEALLIAQTNEAIIAGSGERGRELDFATQRRKEAERTLELTRQGASRAVAVEQAREAEREWKRTADNIERSLTDAIVRGFEKGKSFTQTFIDSLEAAFKSAILTPIIQPIVRPIAEAMSGVMSSVIGGITGRGILTNGGGIGGGLGGGFGMPFGGFGAQTFADFGNFFGSIGATTELGGTFGLMDAIGGFAAANPLAAAGIVAGGLLLGDSLFGDDGNDAPPGYRANNWLKLNKTGDMYHVESSEIPDPHLMPGIASALNAALNDSTKYDRAILDQFVGQSVSVAPGGGSQQLADALLRMVRPAADKLEEAARAQQEAARAEAEKAAKIAQLTSSEAQMTNSLREATAALGGRLGIGSLEAGIAGLAASEYVAPLQRASAARSQVEAAFARAMAGDLDAVASFPSLVQSALAVNRDVFASGPQFQDFFVESNRRMNELLDHQRNVQTEILKDVPIMIREAANDQIAVLTKGFRDMVSKLDSVQQELRALRGG